MTYAKIVDNVVEFAPQNKDNIINYNLDIERMKQDGYKEFIEVERPTTNRHYHIGYIETTETITEQIVYDETQAEADERERQEEAERVSHLKCTKRVFAMMLQELGFDWYNQILPVINANSNAKLEFEYCVELERSNQLIDQIAAQFGITSTQLDDLFKYANGEITLAEFRGE